MDIAVDGKDWDWRAVVLVEQWIDSECASTSQWLFDHYFGRSLFDAIPNHWPSTRSTVAEWTMSNPSATIHSDRRNQEGLTHWTTGGLCDEYDSSQMSECIVLLDSRVYTQSTSDRRSLATAPSSLTYSESAHHLWQCRLYVWRKESSENDLP